MSKLRKKLEELRASLGELAEGSGIGRIKKNLRSAVARGDQEMVAFWRAQEKALQAKVHAAGKWVDLGGGMKQMDQGGYTDPKSIKKFQQGKIPRRDAN